MEALSSSRALMRPLTLFAYVLERATDGGGEGPPTLLGPAGNPFMFPFPAAESGGEMRPRLLLLYGSPLAGFGYLEVPNHSVPPTETGESGAFRVFMVWVGGWARNVQAQVCCLVWSSGNKETETPTIQLWAPQERTGLAGCPLNVEGNLEADGWRE